MIFTNTKMHELINTMQELMFCKGMLGYAIMRNYRLLSEACQDYLKVYEKALVEYGDVRTTDNADESVETYTIDTTSKNFEQFAKEIEPLAYLPVEVNIITIPYTDAMEQLTAAQMLTIEWMLTEDEKPSEVIK